MSPLAPTVVLLLIAVASIVRAGESGVRVERTFLAGAGPSAFAIGLPGGVGFSWDPGRAGLREIWTGGFVVVPRPGAGKLVKPARPIGAVVYREVGETPLRRGGRERVVAPIFRGYSLAAEAIEFRFEIDRVMVREGVRRVPGGLERRFAVAAPGGLFWYVPGGPEGGSVEVSGGEREGEAFVFRIGAEGGSFTVLHRWTEAGP